MGQMMLMLATAALCAAPIPGAGPAPDPPHDPQRELAGVIVAVDAGTPAARVTVELAGGTGAEPERAVLLVSPETEIVVQRANGATRRGSLADLVRGARIRARHTGVAMRSLPPQYHAERIQVLPGS